MAAVFVHGKYLAGDLVRALKIDRAIRSIQITADCQEVASVTIEFVPTPEDSESIMGIMQRYRLQPILECEHVNQPIRDGSMWNDK